MIAEAIRYALTHWPGPTRFTMASASEAAPARSAWCEIELITLITPKIDQPPA
jgi:hypothetical protein